MPADVWTASRSATECNRKNRSGPPGLFFILANKIRQGGFCLRRNRAGFLKRQRALSGGNRSGYAFPDLAQHSKSLECCGRGATWFPIGKPTFGGQARPWGESQIRRAGRRIWWRHRGLRPSMDSRGRERQLRDLPCYYPFVWGQGEIISPCRVQGAEPLGVVTRTRR